MKTIKRTVPGKCRIHAMTASLAFVMFVSGMFAGAVHGEKAAVKEKPSEKAAVEKATVEKPAVKEKPSEKAAVKEPQKLLFSFTMGKQDGYVLSDQSSYEWKGRNTAYPDGRPGATLVPGFGAKVLELKRVRVGAVHLGRLTPGRWRNLKPAEVEQLKGELKR